jgi:hypothetical protein
MAGNSFRIWNATENARSPLMANMDFHFIDFAAGGRE